GDECDPDVRASSRFLDAVDVALRIDDQSCLPVVDEVAAVPELRGLDDDDIHDLLSLWGELSGTNTVPRNSHGVERSRRRGRRWARRCRERRPPRRASMFRILR